MPLSGSTCGSQAGIRGSFSGRHFPARHAAVKLEFEGHFPGTTFRSPCYDEDRKVFNEMAHFPTRDFPAKKLQEGLPERGFNSLSGGHFPPGIQYSPLMEPDQWKARPRTFSPICHSFLSAKTIFGAPPAPRAPSWGGGAIRQVNFWRACQKFSACRGPKILYDRIDKT